MTRTKKAIEYMYGKGWFTTKRLSSEFGITRKQAESTLQSARRASKYHVETKYTDNTKSIRMLTEAEASAKLSYETKLWRVAIFGAEK